jgi:hypothetical protein
MRQLTKVKADRQYEKHSGELEAATAKGLRDDKLQRLHKQVQEDEDTSHRAGYVVEVFTKAMLFIELDRLRCVGRPTVTVRTSCLRAAFRDWLVSSGCVSQRREGSAAARHLLADGGIECAALCAGMYGCCGCCCYHREPSISTRVWLATRNRNRTFGRRWRRRWELMPRWVTA